MWLLITAKKRRWIMNISSSSGIFEIVQRANCEKHCAFLMWHARNARSIQETTTFDRASFPSGRKPDTSLPGIASSNLTPGERNYVIQTTFFFEFRPLTANHNLGPWWPFRFRAKTTHCLITEMRTLVRESSSASPLLRPKKRPWSSLAPDVTFAARGECFSSLMKTDTDTCMGKKTRKTITCHVKEKKNGGRQSPIDRILFGDAHAQR